MIEQGKDCVNVSKRVSEKQREGWTNGQTEGGRNGGREEIINQRKVGEKENMTDHDECYPSITLK